MARRAWSAASEADPFGADEVDPGDDRFAADRPGSTAPAAPEVDPVERARGLAWRSLNKRDRTVNEVGGMLLGKRVEPAVADQVVTELIELGYLNDARYAERFAEDRRRLDAWGSDRIARRLRELGVDQESIEAAVGRPPTARSAIARSASSSAAATRPSSRSTPCAATAARSRTRTSDGPRPGLRGPPRGTTIRWSNRPGPWA